MLQFGRIMLLGPVEEAGHHLRYQGLHLGYVLPGMVIGGFLFLC
jgi:hypothetical protein